jgi:hypothetical protein
LNYSQTWNILNDRFILPRSQDEPMLFGRML